MAVHLRLPNLTGRELLIEVCSKWSELRRLYPEWKRLLAANRSLGLFSTPEWLEPWWRAYGAKKQLRTLVLRDDGYVVGIVPMYVERFRESLPMTVSSLLLVGDGSNDSDDLDFIVQPGYEDAVAKAFLAWAERSGLDVYELNCVSPRSAVIPTLLRLVDAGRWNCNVSHRPASVVPLPGTWEEYRKRLSSKERGKIGHRYRHLHNRYAVNFYRCERMEELPGALETLFRLHQKRWEAKGEAGSFSQPERRLFYYEMAAALLSKGRLELWTLELNGEAVAAQIGMRYGSKVHSLQEGFDPAYASDSVGYVLRSHVLRYCVEHGVREYDFLAGEQNSKQRWGAVTGAYIDLHFARSTSKGGVHIRVSRGARLIREWIKRHTPEPVLKKLLALRHRS